MERRLRGTAAAFGRSLLSATREKVVALDVTIQAQLLALLARLRDELGMAMILISHDLAVVSEVADTIAVMYAGRIVEQGDCATVIERADHPYTRGLLAAVPPVRPERGARFTTMPGVAARGPDEQPGCPFEPRCSFREPRCRHDLPVPEPVSFANGHRSACWVHPSQLSAGRSGG